MKITVTQEDIDKGSSNGSLCPIARGIRRNGCDWYVSVGYNMVSINCYNFRTTGSMKKFIKNFDNGRDVKPHTFILK